MFGLSVIFFLFFLQSKERMAAAPRFSLEGHEVEAKVVSVYDGDTFTAVFPLPMHKDSIAYRWSCRIEGIDTPELREKDTTKKEIAFKARDFARGLLLDRTVRISLGAFDKYGRVLCKPYDEQEKPVAASMIEEGFALEYDGKGTRPWALR